MTISLFFFLSLFYCKILFIKKTVLYIKCLYADRKVLRANSIDIHSGSCKDSLRSESVCKAFCFFWRILSKVFLKDLISFSAFLNSLLWDSISFFLSEIAFILFSLLFSKDYDKQSLHIYHKVMNKETETKTESKSSLVWL